MTKPHKIERLYAWIATDATGEDGIPAAVIDGVTMPLIGSDKARIESLRPFAEQVVAADGLAVRLVEFSIATVLEAYPGRIPRGRHR